MDMSAGAGAGAGSGAGSGSGSGAGVVDEDDLFLLHHHHHHHQHHYEKGSPFSSSNNSASPLSQPKENYQDQSSGTIAAAAAAAANSNSNSHSHSHSNPAAEYTSNGAQAPPSKPAKGSPAKIAKRRSRAASKKAPIAMHSTDASNFRDMVQKLTGIPLSSTSISPHFNMPFLQTSPNRLPIGSNGAALPNPHHPHHLQLPTLDTSVSFLGSVHGLHTNTSNNTNMAFLSRALTEKPSLYASNPSFFGPSGEIPEMGFEKRGGSASHFSSARNPPFDLKPLADHRHMISPPMNGYSNSSASSSSSAASSSISPSLPNLWKMLENEKPKAFNYPTYREDLINRQQYLGPSILSESVDDLIPSRQPTALPLDNIMMLDEMQGKSSYSTLDSWLSFDGSIINHSPKVGLTRTS